MTKQAPVTKLWYLDSNDTIEVKGRNTGSSRYYYQTGQGTYMLRKSFRKSMRQLKREEDLESEAEPVLTRLDNELELIEFRML